jgi:hypothetical protein
MHIRPLHGFGWQVFSPSISMLPAYFSFHDLRDIKVLLPPDSPVSRPTLRDRFLMLPTPKPQARNGRLSELHYAVAGLHDIAWDFNNHNGNLEEALKHSSSHLHFWEAHLDRLSIRRSRERVAQAQLLVRMGR